MVKSHLQSSYIPPMLEFDDEGEEKAYLAEDGFIAQGHDWCMQVVRLKKCTVAIGAVYLTCNEGFGESNREKLFEIRTFLMKCRAPFLLAGDWNMYPSELEACGFLDDIDGVLVVPDKTEATCSSGGLLDYFVVSSALAPALTSCRQVLSTPWKPHIGVEIGLRARPQAVQVRRIVRAPPVLAAVDDAEGRHCQALPPKR